MFFLSPVVKVLKTPCASMRCIALSCRWNVWESTTSNTFPKAKLSDNFQSLKKKECILAMHKRGSNNKLHIWQWHCSIDGNRNWFTVGWKMRRASLQPSVVIFLFCVSSSFDRMFSTTFNSKTKFCSFIIIICFLHTETLFRSRESSTFRVMEVRFYYSSLRRKS